MRRRWWWCELATYLVGVSGGGVFAGAERGSRFSQKGKIRPRRRSLAERRGRHFELRQAAARTAFEVEQRIADENSARDGQYAAEGDQIRSVELQEQIAQMLAPAALPPP